MGLQALEPAVGWRIRETRKRTRRLARSEPPPPREEAGRGARWATMASEK